MASAQQPEHTTGQDSIRFHHGTDEICANDILQNGVDFQQAGAWNGSGEFWASKDHRRAEWFALSHPNSPPAACFEFDLSESALLAILQINPPAARRHGANDFEFLPESHSLLNQHMINQQVVAVP